MLFDIVSFTLIVSVIIISLMYSYNNTNVYEGMKEKSCDTETLIHENAGTINQIKKDNNSLRETINKLNATQTILHKKVDDIDKKQSKIETALKTLSNETEQNRKSLQRMVEQSKKHLGNAKQTLNNLSPIQ